MKFTGIRMFQRFSLVLLMLAVAPVWAELNLNYGIANKHVRRGILQSGQDVIVQGGVDYHAPLGLYAGAWTYTGNFENNNYFELNTYAGIGFNIGPLAIGTGYIRYEFDGNRDPFSEYNMNLGMGSYRISGYWDEDETYRYFEGAANYQFWEKSGFVFTLGHKDDNNHNQTWNYSTAFVMAMPDDVDLEVKLTREDNKGNGLVIGVTKQLSF